MLTRILEPNANEEIVGFYGMNGPDGECCQFGILKAPKDAPLPDSLYDKAELQGGSGSYYDPDNDRRGSVTEEEKPSDVDEADTSDDEVARQSDVPMSWGCDDEYEYGNEEAEFYWDDEDDDGNRYYYEYGYE